MAASAARRIELGKIIGVHGLAGWLKVHSYCEPREQLFEHRTLTIGETAIDGYRGKVSGKRLLIRLDGYEDRTAVEPFVGQVLWVDREQLPQPAPGEYYWSDLEGLQVINTQGETLGRIDHLMATGANDVMVVKGMVDTLIPFVQGQYVKSVDLVAGVVTVDWSTDWL